MSSKLEKRKLPQSWRWTQLGDVCDIISGQSPPSYTYRDTPEGLPFFQGKADFGLRSPTARVWCVAPKKIAMPNDILISVRAPVGPTNVADVECCIGRGLAIIRCKKSADMDFVLSFLKLAQEKISQMGTGSTFSSISRTHLLNLEIPLPPLSEQKRVVADLNKRMAAVEKARAANLERVEAIRALPTAFLREIFSFDDGKLPRGWRWVQLGDVCEIMVGKTPPREDKASFGGRHQWAKISDMNNPIIISTDETLSDKGAQICSGRMIEKGTLLYSFKLSIGKTAFTGTDMFTNEAIAGLTPKDALTLSKAFLRYVLIFGDYGRFADVAAKGKTLNKKKLAQLRIPLLSLSEQKRIVADLNKKMTAVEKARDAAEAESEATHALPTAFLRQAFSGAL